MLIAVKVLNWAAIALFLVGRAPAVLEGFLALLPYAMVLLALRKDATDFEKWGALAANAITVAVAAWVILEDAGAEDPSPLWQVAIIMAYNIVPCVINLVVLLQVFIWQSDEPEPSRRPPPADW